jgi:septum formation protein
VGYRFDIIPHRIEEYISDSVSPADYVQNLAYLKANDVASRVDEALILGADTIVLHKKNILGKPKDKDDAKRMLSMLSNSEHDILSGVCLIDMPSKKKLLRFCRTFIRMRPVTEREIEEYVESGESMDKAGAYAIQGEGKKFIDKIEGSYSNVVGLPLETVKEMINNFVCDINAQKF